MVGPFTELEALLALAVFTTVIFFTRRRTRRKIVRFFRKKTRRFKQWFAVTTKKRREQAAEFRDGQVVSRVRTIDGDTIEDVDTGVRYRVANIDCPETDDRAKCYRERMKGEQAKGAAEILFSTAKRVEVRPVGRMDRHGRTVAYVRVDDQDYGRLMVDKGFAVVWNGGRGTWCGESGGLAVLAKATSSKHVCKTCGAGGAKKSTPLPKKAGDRVVPLFPRRRPADKVED